MILRSVISVVLSTLLTQAALANDSTAELAAGGLVFVKNDNIEMRAEDLFISAQQVRVRYKFFNRSGKDVTVRVAFPMPDISVTEQDDNISVPTQDPVNILGFKTQADGKPIQMEVEQRVFSGKTEYTKFLQNLGIPLAPHLTATMNALDALPPEKQAEFVKRKIGEIVEYDTGKGMQKHLEPRWSLKTNYHWEQTFPAKTEIVIEHYYQPSVGATSGTSIGGDFPSEQVADYTKKYCIDKDFIASAARARKKGDAMAPFTEERVEYILSTGANWSGPIRDFRLVVDKGAPDNLITFCGEGLKKISATQFEMRKTDFTPKGNFSVLILKRIPAN
jgi:uncharacterized protein DUF4424